MRIKFAFEKTYREIIQLNKRDDIFSERMKSVIVRPGKGTE
jgi:hypothetical protein